MSDISYEAQKIQQELDKKMKLAFEEYAYIYNSNASYIAFSQQLSNLANEMNAIVPEDFARFNNAFEKFYNEFSQFVSGADIHNVCEELSIMRSHMASAFENTFFNINLEDVVDTYNELHPENEDKVDTNQAPKVEVENEKVLSQAEKDAMADEMFSDLTNYMTGDPFVEEQPVENKAEEPKVEAPVDQQVKEPKKEEKIEKAEAPADANLRANIVKLASKMSSDLKRKNSFIESNGLEQYQADLSRTLAVFSNPNVDISIDHVKKFLFDYVMIASSENAISQNNTSQRHYLSDLQNDYYNLINSLNNMVDKDQMEELFNSTGDLVDKFGSVNMEVFDFPKNGFSLNSLNIPITDVDLPKNEVEEPVADIKKEAPAPTEEKIEKVEEPKKEEKPVEPKIEVVQGQIINDQPIMEDAIDEDIKAIINNIKDAKEATAPPLPILDQKAEVLKQHLHDLYAIANLKEHSNVVISSSMESLDNILNACKSEKIKEFNNVDINACNVAFFHSHYDFRVKKYITDNAELAGQNQGDLKRMLKTIDNDIAALTPLWNTALQERVVSQFKANALKEKHYQEGKGIVDARKKFKAYLKNLETVAAESGATQTHSNITETLQVDVESYKFNHLDDMLFGLSTLMKNAKHNSSKFERLYNSTLNLCNKLATDKKHVGFNEIVKGMQDISKKADAYLEYAKADHLSGFSNQLIRNEKIDMVIRLKEYADTFVNYDILMNNGQNYLSNQKAVKNDIENKETGKDLDQDLDQQPALNNNFI